MKYGLPYKGSKNKLAERIVGLMPKADHLIDLFCGGCAVSHAALVRGKWPHIHINDIDWRPVTLFQDALAGKYQDETRWISREDFFRLKDTDPYVAIVWSFGNNMRDYLYSQDIESLKRAIHFAMFYGDYEPARLLGHDLSFIDPIHDLQRRYLAVKHYFANSEHPRQQSFEGGGGRLSMLGWRVTNAPTGVVQQGGAAQPHIPSNAQPKCSTSNVATEWGVFQKKKTDGARQPMPNDSTDLHRLQYRERQHALPTIRGGLPLTASVGDYQAVTIPEGSVIYCDIPYKDTNVYDTTNGFDYDRFYEWCARQTQPLFISSYEMPADRFRCIEEFTHRSTLSASANNEVTERIFIPMHQQPPARPVQLSLF